MTRNLLVATTFALIFSATPVFAKEDITPTTDMAATSAPIPVSTKTDNAVQSIGESPSMLDQSMPPDATNGASDTLSNFGPSSGTVVGNRALELRDEILRLRASVNLNSNEFGILRSSGAAGAVQYHSTVAAITARLQNGTTRGNPILLRQWDEASASLDEVNSSLSRLNSLQTAVDADASMASYLLGSVQAAFELSGAVDEDHDQLKLLRDEISRMIVQLDYLRNQTTNDLQRQTNYLTTERSNLQALAFAISRGELLGNSMANRPVMVNQPSVMSVPSAISTLPETTPQAAPTVGVTSGPSAMSPREYMQESGQTPAPARSSSAAGMSPAMSAAPSVGHLLVLIRYNQPNVEYEQQLSQAVGSAIEKRPNAEFSIIAVSPSSGDPAELAKDREAAQRNAEAVRRSLIQLGLAPSRMTMSSTSMDSAQTPEVHVYIR